MVALTPKKLLSACKGKSVLLLCHENSDLDSFVSAAIMQRFLTKNKIHSVVGVPRHVNDQTQHFAFTQGVSFAVNPDLCEFEVVILFDFNEFVQLGALRTQVERVIERKNMRVFAFDHHVKEKGAIVGGANLVSCPECASTTQVLYNFFREKSASRHLLDTFDAKSCFWCCIGIVEDTGHFLVGNERAFTTFAECLTRSKRKYSEVLALTKHQIPDAERIAFLKAAQRANVQRIGSTIIATSELSFYQSAAATKLLDFGAHISLVCGKEKDGITTFSARVDSEFRDKNKFDLVKDLFSELQKEVGGEYGGHSAAAQWKGNAEPKYVLKEAIIILKRLLS